MADNWRVKVDKKNLREEKTSMNKADKAKTMTNDIRTKYNCGMADAPLDQLTDEELTILFYAWQLVGYDKETSGQMIGRQNYYRLNLYLQA